MLKKKKDKQIEKTERQINFYSLPLGSIKPDGWLKEEIVKYTNNYISSVNVNWDKLNENSAWLGGKGDASKYGLEYMLGIVRLAFQTDNEALKLKSKLWAESIMQTADSNGNFGKQNDTDWLGKIYALAFLAAYYDAVKDQKVIDFVMKFLKYQYNFIDMIPPTINAMASLCVEIEALNYFYEVTEKEFLLEAKCKLQRYTYDFKSFFRDLPFKNETSSYLSKANAYFKKQSIKKQKIKEDLEAAQKTMESNNDKPNRKYILSLGSVVAKNLAVLFEQSKFTNDTDAQRLTKGFIETLYKNHGLVNGCFSADNHLDGREAGMACDSQTAVSAMNNLLKLEKHTADILYTDYADTIFYNVIFGLFKNDYKYLQGISSANQLNLGETSYYTENSKSNLFTQFLEDDEAVAATGSVFTEFVQSLIYETDDGYAFTRYAPCRIKTVYEGNPVEIVESTDYPYDGIVNLKILSLEKEQELVMRFNIPQYSSMEVQVNGKTVANGVSGIIVIKKIFVQDDEIALKIISPLKAVFNDDGSLTFRMGDLILANPLNSAVVTDKKDYLGAVCREDYRKAPVIKDKKLEINDVKNTKIMENKFDMNNPIIKVTLKADVVTNWSKKVSVYENIPHVAKFAGSSDMIILIPYSATMNRITQFPYKVLETVKK